MPPLGLGSRVPCLRVLVRHEGLVSLLLGFGFRVEDLGLKV